MDQRKSAAKRGKTGVRNQSALLFAMGVGAVAYAGCGNESAPGEAAALDSAALSSSGGTAGGFAGWGGSPGSGGFYSSCTPSYNRLCPGQQLTRWMYIESSDALYKLLYRDDGNLVMYRKPNNFEVWSSHTEGTTNGAVKMGWDSRLTIVDGNNQVVYTTPNAPNTRNLGYLELWAGIARIGPDSDFYRPGYWQSGDPECIGGISRENVCCSASCGVCGGNGCSTRPGGSTGCCMGNIQQRNVSCGDHQAPCVIP